MTIPRTTYPGVADTAKRRREARARALARKRAEMKADLEWSRAEEERQRNARAIEQDMPPRRIATEPRRYYLND